MKDKELEAKAYYSALKNIPQGYYTFEQHEELRKKKKKTFKEGVKYANSKSNIKRNEKV